MKRFDHAPKEEIIDLTSDSSEFYFGNYIADE